MTNPRGQGSRFAVDLGDVKLPEVIERRVEAEIQAAALRGLADVDFGGSRRANDFFIKQFPGGVAGFVLDGGGGGLPWPPWTDDGSGGSPTPLGPADHTTVIRAIMENPLAVIKNLDKSPKSSKPSGADVLRAAQAVPTIPDWIKELIDRILDVLPKIDAQRGNEPASTRRALDDLEKELKGRSVSDKAQRLRGDLRGRYRSDDGLTEAMEVAAAILEDGADTIYNPDFAVNQLMSGYSRSSRKPSMGATADADGVGATIGGVFGTLAGGVGAGPGAVAGGAAASAGQLVSDIWDWVFD